MCKKKPIERKNVKIEFLQYFVCLSNIFLLLSSVLLVDHSNLPLFLKKKKKSDDQTNIDKYRVAKTFKHAKIVMLKWTY